jgi:hypothetical protein
MAWAELFEGGHSVPSAPLQTDYRRFTCRYSFGWGRNSVAVDFDGYQANCTFSHTERLQMPNTKNVYYATFIQHYACTDGTSSMYTTDFLGANLRFYYQYESQQKPVRCD